MSKRNLLIILVVAVCLMITTGIPTKSNPGPEDELVAGRNVNMTSSKIFPDPEGDLWLQRQNEPSIAVSTINPLHLLAGANDYRSVDSFESVGELPGIPEEAAAGDAWLGVFTSYDGGESWKSKLLPGYIDDPAPEFGDSLKGFSAASDPTVRAGINGDFYYSGIAFSRIRNGPSVIFVARFKDYNITEYPDEGNPDEEEPIYPIRYVDTTIIDEGTSGQFADKPWLAVDIPRNGNSDGHVYLVYSVFLGDVTKTIHDKIMFTRSTDGGDNWATPIKLSESHLKNQGTTLAINPLNGYVYVAWRRFAAGNKPDAIMITKSTDYGITFDKATEASIINFPFDQYTVDTELGTAQFRTLTYPTMAVDNNNTVYLAWAQRKFEDGPARIVFKSKVGDLDWPSQPIEVEDNTALKGHQFMPSMTFAAGKLLIAWYDSRDSVRLKLGADTGKWITDFQGDDCPDPIPDADPYPDEGDVPCHFRETIDVRIAQKDPAISQFEPSTFVSRYFWGFRREDDGSLTLDPGGSGFPVPVQMQHNPPNLPLFKGGEFAFIGDYIDIAPAPMFIDDGGSWRFNTGHSNPNLPPDPFVFYVSWTDNRDVSPPLPDNWDANTGRTNPWSWYGPPNHTNCNPGFNPGMRNQNIYVSRITRGVAIGCPENYKPITTEEEPQRAFVVNVQNMAFYERIFDLDIFNVPDPGSASFLPDDPTKSSLTITVPEFSSVSRHVFVESPGPHTTLVEVSEPGGSVDYVYLHLVAEGGSTGTFGISITETDPVSWSDPPGGILSHDENLINPGFLQPGFLQPGFLQPGFLQPGFLQPGFLQPGFLQPGFLQPGFLQTSITNPGFLQTSLSTNIIDPGSTNSSFTSAPIDGAEIVDKIWRVKNEGTIASSYTLKTIAGDALPDGFYNQLLVYKIHKYAATIGTECDLYVDARLELLMNIVDPEVHPDISSKGKIVDPELWNTAFTNATFSLAPGEEAAVLLRVIDTSPPPPVPFPAGVGGFAGRSGFGGFSGFGDFDGFGGLLGGQDPPISPAGEYADNVGAVVISHSSTAGDITAITLMVLPDSLPNGQAGVLYRDKDGYIVTLRAIGGTESYSWTYSGSLPFGMTLNTDGKITGTPKEAGEFTFTAKVTDNSESDEQKFTLLIHPPPPLTITMDPEPAPNGIKKANYSPNVKFTASGGVLPYSWSLSSGELTGLNLTAPINGSTGETMELTGAPQQAGDFGIIVTVTDDFRPDGQIAAENFNLCVAPLPLIINTPSPLPEGYMGSTYDVELSVSNAEATPKWTVTGLPSGLNLSPSNGIGYNPMITGTPLYDPNIVYPETFDVRVEVTDNFNMPNCYYTRPVEVKTFEITINPKEPRWSIAEVDGVATAVATDSSGNVYVTGYTSSETTGKDYYTAMYDLDGNPVWHIPYNGPGNGDKKDDEPTAIAVNSFGVVVTGSSVGRRSGPDIYTISYDPSSGEVLWEDRYDGPSHLGDGANDLTLDDDGNVYVAGFVHRGTRSKHKDYCIIKYDRSGEIIWDKRYDSTRNGNDEATAIAVDESTRDVYVTGKSQENLKNQVRSHDYLTLKYNRSGRLQWPARDDGLGYGNDEPTDIAIDSSGNIYVSGYATGGTAAKKDYYTVKYNSVGNELWPGGRAYNGTGNGDDVVTAIAVDSSTGDVFVTGKSWGDNGYDYATIRYDSDGNPLWNTPENVDGAIRYNGGIGDDEAVAVAVDGLDIYVAGFITKDGTPSDKDFFIIKYDTSGAIVWIASYASYDGSSGMDDIATAMEVNGTGIYVVGYSEISSGGTAFVVVKYTK